MAKQLTSDEVVVNLRRKARRRLIGAVALTLAVVVILPMVLDIEPKPALQDVELRIPAPDKVGEFVPDMALSPDVAASKVNGAAAASLAASAPVDAVSGVAEVMSADVKAVAASVQPAASSTGIPVKGSDNGQSKGAGQSRGNEGGESFVAQVGAYANPDTAKQEAVRLKKMGFKAYTEKVGGKMRVRVGPYVERERAEKARQLLENHGLHPVVISVK